MRSKLDPGKVRDNYAQAGFRAYALRRGLNKTWEQLDADTKEAWRCAVDEIGSAYTAELESEETFLLMVKLAMRDALTEDHISQFVTKFRGAGLPGKVRILIAPETMSLDFGGPLQGKHDG